MTVRPAVWLALAALCNTAIAQETVTLPSVSEDAVPLTPLHKGYDFERPEILLRQHLFGRAHGLSLLAGACLDDPEQAPASQEAYATWHSRQAAVIREMSEALAAYYFGARAAEATWSDLVRALNLKENVSEVLGEVKLDEACRTLPTVLVGPRYAFDRLLAEMAADVHETEPKVGAGATAPQEKSAPKSDRPDVAPLSEIKTQ